VPATQSPPPQAAAGYPAAPGAPPQPGYPPVAPGPFMGGTPTALTPGQQMAKDAAPLRLVAIIVDGVIIGVGQAVLVGLLFFVPFFYAPVFFWGVIAVLYFALLEGTRGQTLGKMALGLKVVKEDMTPITMEQAVIRAVNIFLWVTLVVALIDLIFVLDNGQRLGDRWAHTVVIKVQ